MHAVTRIGPEALIYFEASLSVRKGSLASRHGKTTRGEGD